MIEAPASIPPDDVLATLPEDCVVHEKSIIITNQDQAPMVYVPSGVFLMGDDSDRADYDEAPVHKVYLDAYLIDIYPVTNMRYRMFLEALDHYGSHPSPWCHPDEPRNKVHIPQFWYSSKWNQDDHPVVGVDWWDAYVYCKWAGKDLPTEAEAGSLVPENDSGGKEPIRAVEMARIGLQSPDLRLVVLSSCHSYREAAIDLVVSKVPMVIGMQSNIHDDAATRFAGKFYLALAQGKTIATALHRARSSVADYARDSATEERVAVASQWWIPALYAWGNFGALVDSAAPAKVTRSIAQYDLGPVGDIGADFVGRRRELRRMHKAIAEGRTPLKSTALVESAKAVWQRDWPRTCMAGAIEWSG